VPNIYRTPWAIALDALLSDGEWHDGLQVVREAEKTITPGVAQRRAESDRARMSAKKYGEAQPRARELPTATVIRIGKRAVMRSLVAARMRDKAYEVDPSPLPERAYVMGGWKVRDVRVGRVSIAELARRHKLTHRTMAALIRGSDITLEKVGRISHVATSDLDQVNALVEAYRVESAKRRSQSARANSEARRLAPPVKKTLTQLARGSNLSSHSARLIVEQNPDMPWEVRGRVTYLPLTAFHLWEEAVAVWNATRRDRRVLGSMKGAATRWHAEQEHEHEDEQPDGQHETGPDVELEQAEQGES
jgi:hypothetical protein